MSYETNSALLIFWEVDFENSNDEFFDASAARKFENITLRGQLFNDRRKLIVNKVI